MKRVALIIALIVVAVLASTLVLALIELPQEKEEMGYLEIISKGRAGEYGYCLLHANGTGNLTLLGLDEKPKDRIVVLSEAGVGMDSFDLFLDELETLNEYGMNVEIVGRADARNVRDAILIVPTGAIPDYILNTIGSTGTFNTLIYIGKTDLKMASTLRKDYWYTQLDEGTKEKIIIKEYTLDEFMDDPQLVQGLKEELLENRWAVVSEQNKKFESFDGETGLFVPLSESGYLRLVYTAGPRKGVDNSGILVKEPVGIETDGQVYPWERAAVSFTLANTTGKAFYTVEKGGVILLSEDLGRIGAEKAFYYTYSFEDPGDYIIKVYDSSGMLASTYIHVVSIDIERTESWDVRTVFSVNIDGEPLKSGDLYVSVNNEEAKRYPVIDGQASVPARLQGGDNVFRVQYLEYKKTIVYAREQAGPLETYIRWGPVILVIIIVVYVGASMRKRPTYTIKIEAAARQERNTMEVTRAEILDAIKYVEDRFGWENVPVTLNEIAYSIRKNITDGADVLDGDLETILRELEKKGFVERHGDYYQLTGWGDVKKNVLMRVARDTLVKNGVAFKEKKEGLDIGTAVVSTEYQPELPKKLIMVFDGEEDKRRFMGSLKGNERARLEVRRTNDLLRLVEIDKLEEIL